MTRGFKRSFQTSWQDVSKWYNQTLGSQGNYFYQHLIIPKTLKLLCLKPEDSLLDLGCGQGILARAIPKDVDYWGVDLAQDLLTFAKKNTPNLRCHFLKADVARPLSLPKKDFTHAAIILTLQNIFSPEQVIKNCASHLRENGRLIIVINHPCFRIPRQSNWGIDEQNKIQYRRINRYLSPLKVPINMRPSHGQRGPITWSFHFSLNTLGQILYQEKFFIEKIEEWISDKQSAGPAAKMENRSRQEFPLFMSFLARKIL